MSTLYEITGDLLALQKLIDESLENEETGETRELIEEEKNTFAQWLNENETNFKTKFDNICKFFKNLKAQAEVAAAERAALQAEQTRLSKRAKARENAADRVNNLIWFAFDKLGMKKYKTELFSVNIQSTKKTAKPALLFNPDRIPARYLRRKLSSSAIDEVVKEGVLYEVDDPVKRGKLYYKKLGIETELEGVEYTGGQALVVR